MTRTKTRRAAWLMAPLLTFVLFVGCGSSDDGDAAKDAGTTTAATDAEPQSGDVAVSIKGFKFAPPDLTVTTGSKVTWTNDDSSTHTATADDDAFDTDKLAEGKAGTFTFSEAGTFAYHCEIHKTMKATVTVE